MLQTDYETPDKNSGGDGSDLPEVRAQEPDFPDVDQGICDYISKIFQ